MPHALPAEAPDGPDARSLEVTGAVVFGLYVLAQLAQDVILAHAPLESDTASTFAFSLSAWDRFRAASLLACFIFLPAGYAAVHQRLGRQGGWGLAGLMWILVFLAAEMAIRAWEFSVVASWQRDWLAATDTLERTRLAGLVNGFSQGVVALYLPLLAVHALASGAFALALRGRDRWSRWARAGFALNAFRALLRLGAMHLGLDGLTPVADALYLPLTVLHGLAVALWLGVPARPARSGP
ncbi:hypothetical protein [Corallococcus carmarthensis]|uniref:DUF4386 family protein n=1 Tax=Corallococcus carmarthensis TaxID=2316728 RepID=A0A3A8JR25_9BACT|nr:hypothetical protein [Corallococcus carmarthensis]NOK23205.1 hypothetical protein [Corallococcus carmarthensis]RKG98237.1 hypothetical protein D7X32_30135 [Corallococcus carmarthensis]